MEELLLVLGEELTERYRFPGNTRSGSGWTLARPAPSVCPRGNDEDYVSLLDPPGSKELPVRWTVLVVQIDIGVEPFDASRLVNVRTNACHSSVSCAQTTNTTRSFSSFIDADGLLSTTPEAKFGNRTSAGVAKETPMEVMSNCTTGAGRGSGSTIWLRAPK